MPAPRAPEPLAAAKAPGAYRTITEVAAELGVAAHVLRFWESKFNAIKPLKKSGGRRYYKPDDVALLKHIQDLLHTQGYSVRGVQTYLNKTKKAEVKAAAAVHGLTFAQVCTELLAIRATLVGEGPGA
jgi:DNA-binding transcriptional MerR regulator